MLLNIHNICEYLIDKNYLKPDDILTSGFCFTEESRRNKNFLIRKKDNTGILLKQVRAYESSKTYSIENEAKLYWLVNNEREFKGLKNNLAKFYGFDANHYILSIELHINYTDLLKHYENSYNFISEIPLKQADILSSFHNKLELNSSSPAFKLFSNNTPWIFNIAEAKPQELNLVSKADYEILNYIRSNYRFCDQVRTIQQKWTTDSIIHGDIKMPNFLINSKKEVKLIDWEMVQIGDALWDVAGIFNDYFIFWVNLKHMKNKPFPKNTIASLFKSLNSFWNHYSKKNIVISNHVITKLGQYTALRIVQTCIEHSHFMESMSSKTKELLDLSFQLINNPEGVLDNFINTHPIQYES